MNNKRVYDRTSYLNERFESVQSLRGIAALFVVCQHICFLGRGSFGVDIFFIISGFMIMFATEKSPEHFLIKRIVRIVPFYYLMTGVTFAFLVFAPGLFDNTTANPIQLIKSLLFIPFQISEGVVQPIVRVGWTINYEMMFYLLFWIAMKISFRFRGLICSIMLLLLEGIGLFAGEDMIVLRFYSDSVILEFALGIGLFYLFGKMYEVTGEKNKTLSILICVLTSAACFAYMWYSYGNEKISAIPEIVRWGIPSVLVLISWFYMGLKCRMPKVFVFVGDISFSLYLTHYYLMRLLSKLLKNSAELTVRGVVLALLFVGSAIVVARLCHFLIEEKLTDAIKKKMA